MKLNKKVICDDGFHMSVQANEYAFCMPRINDARTYTAVEIGFPNHHEPLLNEYIDGDADAPHTGAVFAYVPAHIVTLVCAKHGGVVEGELPACIPYLKAI